MLDSTSQAVERRSTMTNATVTAVPQQVTAFGEAAAGHGRK